jgi:hypothetical protein
MWFYPWWLTVTVALAVHLCLEPVKSEVHIICAKRLTGNSVRQAAQEKVPCTKPQIVVLKGF